MTISRGVMIRPSSYYGGDLGIGLTMGEHSSIGPYGYVGCSGTLVTKDVPAGSVVTDKREKAIRVR